MARLYFVVALGLVALASQESRADDPIVAEITELENQLFYHSESANRVSANQTLERLIRLESLAAQRTEQYWQLVTDVRELISFSQTTDEKCRANDESVGVMLNFDAYFDISQAIRDYWTNQVIRQLKHCLVKLNEALAGRDDTAEFMALIETVKSRASMNTLRDQYIEATLAVVNSGQGDALLKSELKFNKIWDELIRKPCNDTMPTIEPWVQIFLVHQSVFYGIHMEEEVSHGETTWREYVDRAKFLSWGAKYCEKIDLLKEDILERYMPRGFEAILNHALLRDYQGFKTAVNKVIDGSNQ